MNYITVSSMKMIAIIVPNVTIEEKMSHSKGRKKYKPANTQIKPISKVESQGQIFSLLI